METRVTYEFTCNGVVPRRTEFVNPHSCGDKAGQKILEALRFVLRPGELELLKEEIRNEEQP
jgi:hypothetical protein